MSITRTLEALTVTTIPVAVGAVRAVRAKRALYPAPLPDAGDRPAPPAHDRDRLTAVVLLDHAGAEVSDFLLPYELLAASEAFNVYAVAPEARPAVLTGGLDVLPHLSLRGFEDLGLDRADLLVVPHLPTPDPRLIDLITAQAQAGSVVLSICTGAAVVAAAGVLDGWRATTFWGEIGRLERRHPKVQWVRGVRFVDDGEVAASAGITSGIDATLHMIRRLAGRDAQLRAARALGYTDRTYLRDPAAEQYRPRPADLILPLTAAFGRRPTFAVLLEDGGDEAATAALMDTYAATFTRRLTTVTRDGRPVRSRHGLTLLPRTGAADVAGLARMLRPIATDASPPYLAYQDAIADLAVLGGRPIATFAAKRLEHRVAALPGTATGWPTAVVRLLAAPVAAAVLGLAGHRRRAARKGRDRSRST